MGGSAIDKNGGAGSGRRIAIYTPVDNEFPGLDAYIGGLNALGSLASNVQHGGTGCVYLNEDLSDIGHSDQQGTSLYVSQTLMIDNDNADYRGIDQEFLLRG